MPFRGLLRVLVLGLVVAAGGATATWASGPEGPFAQDFSPLTPPVPAPLEAFQDLDCGPARLADFRGGVVLLSALILAMIRLPKTANQIAGSNGS